MGTSEKQKRKAVIELLRAHSNLDDRPVGAIWLKSREDGVWLLEIIPTMPDDDRADEPMEFLPSGRFRYALRLYTGRENDLVKAIKRDKGLARDVVLGEPLPRPTASTKRLQREARKIADRK